MIILKRGISGYKCDGEVTALIDHATFRATYAYAASRLGVSVLDSKVAYTDQQPYHNYHVTWFSHRYEESMVTALFLNAHYPILALTDVSHDIANGRLPEYWMPDWASSDDSELLQFFSNQYQIVTAVELRERLIFQYDSRTRTVQLENPNDLCLDELRLIYEWRPQTVSEVLFNEWD